MKGAVKLITFVRLLERGIGRSSGRFGMQIKP